jgi:hypothetical protein
VIASFIFCFLGSVINRPRAIIFEFLNEQISPSPFIASFMGGADDGAVATGKDSLEII